VFRDKEYNIRFVGCSIFPQGYSAIIGELRRMSDVNMVADIGNGTMNVMYIIDKKPFENKCWTEKLGVNQLVIAAQNALMDKFGVKVEDTIIQNVIRRGTADIGKNYLDCIINSARTYAGSIFETLGKYEYKPELVRLYVVGGGGCIKKNFAEYDKERVTIIEDICATAKGYERLAHSMLKKQEQKAGEVGGGT
jgi:plasmid segregation protein ParM